MNFEKTTLGTKKQFEKDDMTSVNLEKSLEYLEKTCDLKITELVIYVKEYFYYNFFFYLKDITQVQNKTNYYIR